MSDTLSIPYGDPTDSPDTETESGYGEGKGAGKENENRKRDFETAALEESCGTVGALPSEDASSVLKALGRSNSPVEKTGPYPAANKQTGSAPDPVEGFDWFHDEEVIIERQMSVAVYRNARNHVVIRGESEEGQDQDAFVIVSTAQALNRLIDALTAEKKKGGLL